MKKITYYDLAPHRLGEILRRMRAEFETMKATGKNPAPLSNELAAAGMFNSTCSNYVAAVMSRDNVEWHDLTKHCRRKILEHFGYFRCPSITNRDAM